MLISLFINMFLSYILIFLGIILFLISTDSLKVPKNQITSKDKLEIFGMAEAFVVTGVVLEIIKYLP